MASRYLDSSQLQGLRRAGDALIPGGQGLPSFSQSGVESEADRMLAYMTEEDRSGLLGLLGVFAWLPGFVIAGLIYIADRNRFFPGPVAALLRMVSLGVKGCVYTLYYGDERIHPLIHWDASVGRRK